MEKISMEAIEKVSVVYQVEDRLLEYILDDNVKIGDKLPPENMLSKGLGVGRGTIREAIRLLEAKGYVEVYPGRGSFVARKEEPEMQDLANWFRENEFEIKDYTEVRMALEPLAVKLATERCTEKDIKKLHDIHEKAKEAAKKQDAAKLAICDEDFHTCIVECSKNKLLIAINKEVIKSLKIFRGNTFRIPGNVRNFIPAHEAILNAIENRDVRSAQKMLMRHLEYVYEDLESSKNVYA